MVREKPPAQDDPRFVWESEHSTKRRRRTQSQRQSQSHSTLTPTRVIVAGTIVAVLGGGAFGVISHTDRRATTVANADSISTATHQGTALANQARGSAPIPTVPKTHAAPKPKTAATATAAKPGAPTTNSLTNTSNVVTVYKTETTDPPAAPAAPPPTSTGPAPLGAWSLNGNALNSAGSADGIASDVAFSAGAADFAGTNASVIETPDTVLQTGPGDSFTVSAWLDVTAQPTSKSQASTAVSQNAGINSAFYLQYFGGMANRWAFARMDTNTVLSNAARAESVSIPAMNTWTHLVGVYDASDGGVYLYVNGDLQGTAVDTTPVASSGPLVIGGARYNSTASDAFTGDIRDVKVYNEALSASEVEELN